MIASTNSNLLIDEYPLIVLPKLAARVGLQEAILLQQIHYWIGKSNHIHEGQKWIYNTFDGWHEQFPFMSVSTIKRVVKRLREPTDDYGPLLIIDNFNKRGGDKTLWYRINYLELSRVSDWHEQSVNLTRAKYQPDTSVTRDYAETIAETNAKTPVLTETQGNSENSWADDPAFQ